MTKPIITIGTIAIALWVTTAIAERKDDHAVQQQQQARQAFDAADHDRWKQVFNDPCTGDWHERWFLDGEIGKVTTSDQGMQLTAGPEYRNDAHHMVLWTKDPFEGDLKIEYDYTRLDEVEHRSVTILYIQATGSGKGPYARDISQWNDWRKVPSMRTYFNHMNAYHISYAADPGETPYIRGRRYMPEKQGLKGTGLEPDYYPEGLFEPGVPHHMTWIKLRSELHLKVICPDTERLFRWDTSGVEPVTVGRIGLRHMFFRSARYANFDVALAG